MDGLHLNLVSQVLVQENILNFNFLLALYSTSRKSLPDSHGKGQPPRQAVELILDLSPPPWNLAMEHIALMTAKFFVIATQQ